MKTISKTSSYLLMITMFLAAALPDSVAADKELPFRGSVQAVELFDVQFPTLFVDASGSGNATYLGRFTVTFEEVVDLLTQTGIGSAHFIAANGDSVFTVTEALDPPESPEPEILIAVVTHTITGGTGRFAGATGSFKEEKLINLATGAAAGCFEGTIAFGKAK